MRPHISEEQSEALNFDTDKVDNRKMTLNCPTCNRKFAPLCSKSTRKLGHQNWGCPEFDEFISMYITRCGKCHHEFKFTVGE